MKKTRAIKLNVLEEHMTLTSLLMFSPEFNMERRLCNTSVLSSHTRTETLNLILCGQVKEEIKGMDIC